MKKRQGRRRLRKPNLQKISVQVLLDSGTPADIRKAKQVTATLLKYQWDYYAELARQRNSIQEEIKQALIQVCIPYELEKWQRAVKYKYALHPLSIKGSLTYIGGRFNTGTGVNAEIPSFPALYLAQDKDTALQEHLGQEPANKQSKLTPREIALTNAASEIIVSVSGKLDKVFDLRKGNNLTPFVELIKSFKLSSGLKEAAKKLHMKNPGIVRTPEELIKTLLHPDWRQLPSNYDVPTNSQIFGHLIYSSGIEGILYPSKFTGKLCFAVYPRNFPNTESYIKLDDELPHPKVPSRIDGVNWRVSEMELRELMA